MDRNKGETEETQLHGKKTTCVADWEEKTTKSKKPLKTGKKMKQHERKIPQKQGKHMKKQNKETKPTKRHPKWPSRPFWGPESLLHLPRLLEQGFSTSLWVKDSTFPWEMTSCRAGQSRGTAMLYSWISTMDLGGLVGSSCGRQESL